MTPLSPFPNAVSESNMAGRVESLTLEHRALDDLLGRFLGAAHANVPDAAREALAAFDDELRRHTAFEEEEILPRSPGRKLVAIEPEAEGERLSRELRLEHVQIREVSGMMRRLVEEGDLEGARRLAPNLARRWDAHTEREEREFARMGIKS
jgi:hypothetical protein